MLQAALVAGLAAEGAGVFDLGVLPTPGVAWFSAAEGRPAAVLSASHNPFADNGIKFFAAGGRKLDDATEDRLEAELGRLSAGGVGGAGETLVAGGVPVGAGVGRVAPHPDPGAYARGLVGLPGVRLDGLRLVLDCANGAASGVAPEVFRALGAEVAVIHDRPDGVNINQGCGSTEPGDLQREVVARGADAGLAFDGDADRVVAVDHRGALVDGDQLIALCAVDRKQRGQLPGDTVVVTVMANLGFREAMAAHGIRVEETPVGDRFVLERLEQGGWALGGEQSGHVIFRDLATTGDGLLTGLEALGAVVRAGRPLADLAAVMTRRPQVLRNVRVADRDGLASAEGFWAEVRAVESSLGGQGRVLVRASGTEALVRVMVEAHTEEAAEAACGSLADALARSLGSVGSVGSVASPGSLGSVGGSQPAR
jgi:phosphoglucosamine mutase